MRPLAAALGALLLATSAHPARAQTATPPEAAVPRAMLAFHQLVEGLPFVQCGEPEIWEVGAGPDAARSVADRLKERGWAVLDQAAGPRLHTVIADPDPRDPAALAVGGWLNVNTPERTVAFLALCRYGPDWTRDYVTGLPALDATGS